MFNGSHPPFVGRFGYLGPDGALGYFPLDDLVDEHGGVRGALEQGRYLDDPRLRGRLDALGHSGEWTAKDSDYAVRRAGQSGKSLMREIWNAMVGFEMIGVSGEETPQLPAYPKQPTPDKMVDLLEMFSIVTRTDGNDDKQFAVAEAYKHRLTAENIHEWMLINRGLVEQPGESAVDPAAKSKLVAFESALARWGAKATEATASAEEVEAARVAFVATGRELLAMVSVEPGEVTPDSGFGYGYTVNRRRAKHRLILVLDQGVVGQVGYALPRYNPWAPFPGNPALSADDAAKKLPALAGVLGVPSRYDGLLSSAVIDANGWDFYGNAVRWDGTRYTIDPNWKPSGGSSDGIGPR